MVIEVGNPFFRHHYEVHCWQFVLTQTKAFTRQTFNPIAFMRASNVFLGDSKTDTGMPQRIQAAEMVICGVPARCGCWKTKVK